MPIEIKELHIKINVDNNSVPQRSLNANRKSDKWMKDYVEQVMNIEKRKKER